MGPFHLTIVMEAPEKEALNCTLGPSSITSDSDTTPYCKKINIDPDGSPPVRCVVLCIPLHVPAMEIVQQYVRILGKNPTHMGEVAERLLRP